MRTLLAALAVCIAVPAWAQTVCLPHEEMASALAEQYGEHRHARMLNDAGSMIELWGRKGDTWTLTLTAPGGPTCIIAAGTAFDPIRSPLPDDGDPA